MSDAADLYETDFAVWAETQADVLRAARDSGANIPLDWENLVEEVEGLARSDRRTLASRIETVIEHLLKLSASPADRPRAGWKDTVRRTRGRLGRLLEDNRSLRRDVPEIVANMSAEIADRVLRNLEDRGEISPILRAKLREARFTADQVLGDWFPDNPDPA